MYDERPSGAAPFNMALATLERINKMLEEIKKISVNPSIISGESSGAESRGYFQSAKYNLIKQFYIASVPLLKNNAKDIIEEEFNQIRLVNGEERKRGARPKQIPMYSQDVDDALDNVCILVQELLQSEGYFMPDKEDPRFALLGK